LKINLNNPPPKSPSQGGIQKIFDFLPTINHDQWGKAKYNSHCKFDWGTIPPLEGDKGGGQLKTLIYRLLASLFLCRDVISTYAVFNGYRSKSLSAAKSHL
jgi:hypothetical protein